MTHGDGGKGSARRPGANYGDGYDRIFGKKDLPITMEPDETDEDEDDVCSWCRGCGEGKYDGSACSKCHGTGVEPVERDDDA